MQDGCNRSGKGVRRGNVFVDSHHFDISDDDIDDALAGKIAVNCIIPSFAGSKS
jgi:hypothetical protein